VGVIAGSIFGFIGALGIVTLVYQKVKGDKEEDIIKKEAGGTLLRLHSAEPEPKLVRRDEWITDPEPAIAAGYANNSPSYAFPPQNAYGVPSPGSQYGGMPHAQYNNGSMYGDFQNPHFAGSQFGDYQNTPQNSGGQYLQKPLPPKRQSPRFDTSTL
jgi:hypothetical protein